MHQSFNFWHSKYTDRGILTLGQNNGFKWVLAAKRFSYAPTKEGTNLGDYPINGVAVPLT